MVLFSNCSLYEQHVSDKKEILSCKIAMVRKNTVVWSRTVILEFGFVYF